MLTLVMCTFLVSKGQAFLTDSTTAGDYTFVNYTADTLLNAQHLEPFFKKLLKLEEGDTNQVSILHIGDSHIQADMLTREVRKGFQLQFGNAGRGLVFPLRVAGTNEPADYRSSANTSWVVAKINSPARYPEPGVSGISMSSNENGAFFDVSTFNHDNLDYSFNKVTLIHVKDSLQYDCRISDSPTKAGYLMSSRPQEKEEITTSVPFLQSTNYVRIAAEQTEAAQQSITVNGLILQNNKPGILYHSVGINGAHFKDYNNSSLFYTQLKVLKPDLLIISLGTNEGANINITEDEMVASVVAMIHNIRALNPETCILITTPADNFFRKKYNNPYLEAVERGLLKSAELENVACWDMYSITGGNASRVEWRKAALMQKDGIHFNKQGYILQGSLLFKALIDSYQKYAAN